MLNKTIETINQSIYIERYIPWVRILNQMKNEDGTLITNRQEIASRQADYFDQLLNCWEP